MAAAIGMASFPRRYDTSGIERGVCLQDFYNIHPKLEFPADDPRRDSFEIPPAPHSKNAFREGGVITIRNTPAPEVVLIGDSHAIQWAGTIDQIAEKHGLSTAFYAMHSWSPFCRVPPKGDSFYTTSWMSEADEAMLKYISEWKPKTVLIGQSWVRDEGRNKNSVERCIPLIQWLADRGIKVILIEDQPHLRIAKGRDAVQESIFRGIRPVVDGRQYFPSLENAPNKLVHELASRYSHVSFVKIYDLFYRDGKALMFDGNHPVYVDSKHLTEYGARIALPRIEKAIVESIGN